MPPVVARRSSIESPPAPSRPAAREGTEKPNAVEYANFPYFASPCRAHRPPGPAESAVTWPCAVRCSRKPATGCGCTGANSGSGSSSAAQNGWSAGSASGRNALNAQYGEPGAL